MALQDYIWYLKYRPKNLAEMSLPENMRRRFTSYIDEENIPHLLLHGPKGSGKTTVAHIFISHLPCQSIVLNASSEDRGVATIKKQVKDFASSAPALGKRLKIIFMDEADGLTAESMDALRGTMERYAKSARFILTANNYDKMIEPIQSRCTEFRFEAYPKDEVFKYLAGILNEEEIEYNEDDILQLIDRFYPDVRTIVNKMQSACYEGEYQPDAIAEMRLDTALLSEQLTEGNIRAIREMWAGTTDFLWLYKWLFNDFVSEIELDEEKIRPQIARRVAEYMYRDSSVADKEINASACLVEIMFMNGIEITF